MGLAATNNSPPPPRGPPRPTPVNVPYNELVPSTRVYTAGGVPKPTHNGTVVGLSDTLWVKWVKNNLPQSGKTNSGRALQLAIEKYNTLNGLKPAEHESQDTKIKVVDWALDPIDSELTDEQSVWVCQTYSNEDQQQDYEDDYDEMDEPFINVSDSEESNFQYGPTLLEY